MEHPDSAAAFYKRHLEERSCFLTEAYRSAKLTIPYLIPSETDICERSTPTPLPKPHQSLGARGVKNLASKLLLALLPPTTPFVKYVISEDIKEVADEEGSDLEVFRSRLARREQRLQAEVELQGLRPKVFQLLLHLFVAGNVLVYHDPKDGSFQLFPLFSYVVKRDGRGNVLDLVYVEIVTPASLDDEAVKAALMTAKPEMFQEENRFKPARIYTRVQLNEEGTFDEWQEAEGVVIDGTEKTFTKKDSPYMVLRMNAVDGEDYGHGFIEEYRGDLTAFEQLSRDAKFASGNAAKVVWGIEPTSPLKPRKFLQANNGDAVMVGRDDIQAIRLDKGGDMQVTENQMVRLERALQADFLLNSSFQRNQERVTAEEIRRMAQELDDTLGGVFSLLAQELLLPLANQLEAGLIKREESFRALPEDAVRTSVVTGLAAIGRGQDLNRLREAGQITAEFATLLPTLGQWIGEQELLNRIWTGVGVDTMGLVKSEEDVAAENAAAQQAQSAQTMGEQLARGAGNVVGNIDPSQVDPEAIASIVPQE